MQLVSFVKWVDMMVILILNWMRNKDVIMYLGLWESINNINFKGVEIDTFKNEADGNIRVYTDLED